ncbi:MAG: phosphatidate cytidylyltransferase [Pseudomonadota bacterium]
MADGDLAAPDKRAGTSDLPVRVGSAVVMALIAGAALWIGGWLWVGFVTLVGGLVLWEWNRLVRGTDASPLGEVLWLFFGAIYVCGAALAMIQVRMSFDPLAVALIYILPVIAVDVGAYFVGRAVGGPKIAPRLSPSKTWAGLAGGALGAGAVAVTLLIAGFRADMLGPVNFGAVLLALLAGALIAIIAQAGDFFESWMKRRAGMKDSSGLIPGHGGVFDRVDGFLAVFFVLFVVAIAPGLIGGIA